MNHHSFKSSYNYLIFGTLRPSSFYSFYQEKWYPYRKLISRCKCSCLSVSLALNACACNRWPDFTWRPPAISFSVFQNSLGSRQINFLPGTYRCSYFRVTCWIYYSNKFYDFNFDETLYQIQWLVRWFYEEKKGFLSDVMLFEMLKFVIDCKDFIIIAWWYVSVINKTRIC